VVSGVPVQTGKNLELQAMTLAPDPVVHISD